MSVLVRVSIMGSLVLFALRPDTAVSQQVSRLDLSFNSGSDPSLAIAGAELPKVSQGQTVAVCLSGDMPPNWKTAWTFKLGDQAMTAVTQPCDGVAGTVPVAAGATVQITVKGGPSLPGGAITLDVIARKDNQPPSTTSLDISTQDPKEHIVNLLILETGLLALPAPVITDNDIINVYLALPSEQATQYRIDLLGNIKGEDVAIAGQASLGEFAKVARPLQLRSTKGARQVSVPAAVLMGTYGPFSAPQLTLRVSKGSGDTGLQRDHVFRVRRTYVAGLSAGAAVANIRFNKFVVRPAQNGGSPTIGNEGGQANEVRPFLMVQFYSWQFWDPERFWKGRDLEAAPRSILDRFSIIAGAGLRKVGDEYFAGVALELARGLDVFYGQHFAKVEQLDGGLQPGGTFTGEASDLPIRKPWENRSAYGASIDLRIVTGILTGLFSSGGQ